jgi:hypothetical protein
VPFIPEKVWLNRYNKLNQARLDHEFTVYSDASLYPSIPFAEVRIYKEFVMDSAFIRAEHIWAAPDASPFSEGVDSISRTHYWSIDGFLGATDHFSARFNYDGIVSTDLDYDFIDFSEGNVVLLYRKDASEEWRICPASTPVQGSLTNGSGYIAVDTLLLGQYAIGKGDMSVGVIESSHQEPLKIFPNPASDVFFIELPEFSEGLNVSITDITGKCVYAASIANGMERTSIDISSFAVGVYQVLLQSDSTISIRLQVMR